MRRGLRVTLVGCCCAAVAGATVFALTNPLVGAAIEKAIRRQPVYNPNSDTNSPGNLLGQSPPSNPSLPLFSDEGFENGGFGTACRYTGLIRDRRSLDETRDAIRSRAKRGIEDQLSQLRAISSDSPDAKLRVFHCQVVVGYLYM